jgi:hypothetical protein
MSISYSSTRFTGGSSSTASGGTLDIQARKDLSTEEIECCSDDE